MEFQSFEQLSSQKEFTVHCILENLVDERLNIVLDMPVILTSEGHQLKAYDWLPSSFHSGIILPGRKVEIMCTFASKIKDGISKGDRIAISGRISGLSETIMLECPVSITKDKCYLVTAGFGHGSSEYILMSSFRDQVLMPRRGGRFFVEVYYTICEHTLPILSDFRFLPKLLKIMLNPIIGIISCVMRKKGR